MALVNSDLWEARSLPLNQLHFHPANPRLPELRGKSSEREIIHELCANGRVEVLCKAIADKGYFRNDRLIVVADQGGHIVYEGNRRLCALKVLAHPELAPSTMQKAFRRLAERARIPSKIAVEVVPSKFDAEVVMFSKHAGEQFTVGWDPLQQATFIAAKMDQGDTIEHLCAAYGLTHEEVVNARAAVDVYRLARLAKLTPAAQALVDNPSKFPYSTIFERLFRPRKSRALLGAEIGDGGLAINAQEEAVLTVLAQIVDDAATDRINTRSLNTEEQQIAYASALSLKLGGGRTTADEAERRRSGETPRASPTAAPPVAAKRRRPRRFDRLLPRDLMSYHGHEKLDLLIDEGSRMKVSEFPHAGALLLRTLLETALVISLKSHRQWGEACKVAKSRTLGPTLSEMLDYVNQHRELFGVDISAAHALEALVARKVKESKPQLDRIAHVPEVITHEVEVVSIREQAVPLLRKLLIPRDEATQP